MVTQRTSKNWWRAVACMHRNLQYHTMNLLSTIDSLLSNTIYSYMHIQLLVTNGKLLIIRAVIMSQECTQPSIRPCKCFQVSKYFSTGLVMTLLSQCICISEKEELNGWTHPSLSFWRLWFTWKTLTSAHTPSAEILLPLRLQNVRQHKRELFKLHHQCINGEHLSVKVLIL